MNAPQVHLEEEASRLLHALIAQELSALDFCFLWQDLVSGECSLAPVDRLVRRFLESAELGSLDRALALLPPPPESRSESLLPKAQKAVDDWRENWHWEAKRIRETTYLDLRCRQCGFELTLAAEHPHNSELRLPFESLTCPLCEPDSPGP